MSNYDTIIGLDCSLTDTGIVRIDLHDTRWDLISKTDTSMFEKMKDPMRQVSIINTVMRIVHPAARLRKVAVVIEDYAFGSIGGKTYTRAELVGALKYLLLTCIGVDVYLVSPTSLKKFMGVAATGKRVKRKKGEPKPDNKEPMRIAAAQKFNFHSLNNNVVDAYCLCRYLVSNRSGQTLPVVGLRALTAMRFVQVPAPKLVLPPRKGQ